MKYVKELEGLRGLMALWVVIGHWSTTADIPKAIGQTKLYNAYAVDVFVILSGFAITAMMLKRTEDYTTYITKRFFRIFPIYLFYLGLSILFARFALDTWQLVADSGYMNARRVDIAQNSLDYFLPHTLAHMFAVQGVVPANLLPDTDFAFLGQAWSISLEWQFYLAAPILIGCLLRPSAVRIAVAIGLCAVLVLLSRDAGAYVLPRGFLGTHLHKFFIGIFSALALDWVMRRDIRLPQWSLWVLFAVGCALTLAVLERKWLLPYGVWYWTLWVICAWHMGHVALAGLGSRILTAPVTLWLGQMSYSIYLSHMLIIVFLARFLHVIGAPDGWAGAVLLLALLVPITLGVSWYSYRLIEKPFNDFGRGLRYAPKKA